MNTQSFSPKLAALAVAVVVALSGVSASAAPAPATLHTLTQPGGGALLARQWGDEFLSGWETRDGYSIVFDAASKTWFYAVTGNDGRLVSSGQPAGVATPPAPPHLRPSGAALHAAALRHTTRQGFAAAAQMKPVTPRGTANVLTVLVNFADTTPRYGKSDFDTGYFTADNSLATFYREQSRGVFSVSAGPAGVVAWINLAREHDYYGADDPADPQNKDVKVDDLIPEVVTALNSVGFNFAPYDGNGDCYVDTLAVIYQGTGQHESDNSNDIWPSQGDVPPVETNSDCPSGGKIKVSKTALQNETTKSGDIATFATYAHEFGHALGLPDLYDTSYQSEGVGNWSLMASGDSRNGDGKPIGLDPWSKMYLGWVTPTLVTGRLSDVTIEPVLTSGTVYQMLAGTPYSGEYFLIENRARTGYDGNLQGSGLMVWHIDGNLANNRRADNMVNNNACVPGGACAAQHLGVSLVQADNLWNLEKKENDGDAGDPFPGSANVTAIDDATAPNLKLWSGEAKGLSISAIRASGNNIVATFDLGVSASATDGSERLFKWAEFKYPQIFPQSGTNGSAQGYTYRFYPATGVYLATRAGRVIVHNGREWNMLDVGALADFLATAAGDGY